jgi:hypothetical protein
MSLLAALAIAGAACLAGSGAAAQPFGRAHGQRGAEFVQARNEGRGERHGEGRGEERGRGGGRGRGDQGDQGERGYRGQPYAREPRGYAYPQGPAYRYQPAAPPAYAQPRAYGYAPPPAPRYAPNSLGSGWRPQQDDARRGVREGRMASLSQVMENIRRTTPGRMLDAGVEPGPDGRPTYRVRWAAEGGRRIDFIVDAATGAIIGRSGY